MSKAWAPNMSSSRNPDQFLSKVRGLTKAQLETLREFEREKAAQGMLSGKK